MSVDLHTHIENNNMAIEWRDHPLKEDGGKSYGLLTRTTLFLCRSWSSHFRAECKANRTGTSSWGQHDKGSKGHSRVRKLSLQVTENGKAFRWLMTWGEASCHLRQGIWYFSMYGRGREAMHNVTKDRLDEAEMCCRNLPISFLR